MSDETTTTTPPDDTAKVEVMNDQALEKAHGPVTIEDFAATEEGLARIERGIEVFKTLRRASIALTYPQDWVLNKAENRVTGYLQDTGVQRIWDLWGIEEYDLGDYERTDDKETGNFAISITGSAFCKRTGKSLERITGTRYSEEEFIVKRKLSRIKVEPEVRKAARANLDGNLGRNLMGMKNVPVEELDEVWSSAGMTWKSSKLCVHGHGFGTQYERQGGTATPEQAPTCPICKVPMRKRDGQYGAYWGCNNYKTCKQKSINDEDWQKELAKKKPAASAPSTQQQPTREPGDEPGYDPNERPAF